MDGGYGITPPFSNSGRADGQENSQVSTETLKVKEKKPGQRACDEKDAKGELCVGHLKRWYYYHPIRLTASEDEAAATRQFGKVAEYLPL